MKEQIYQCAERIMQLNKIAYDAYLPLVEDVCSRKVSEDELSHLLDYMLGFAHDFKMLELYKRGCKKYLYIYPDCIEYYVKEYWEMWEDGNS